MSTEQMRKLIESVNITESYDDRVRQVIEWINQSQENGITKDEFDSVFRAAVKATNPVEYRSVTSDGTISTAMRDFKNDVKSKIIFKKKPSASTTRAEDRAAKRQKVRDTVAKLAYIIADAAGGSFPDGDPWDHIFPKARKMGINEFDMLEWLDKAAQEHLGAKNYHDYLGSLWDDVKADSAPGSEMARILQGQNPWR